LRLLAKPWKGANVGTPVACAPQAWAAGAVFLVLQSCLGLSVHAAESRICLSYPSLPESIQAVRIQNLCVGGNSIDLRGEAKRTERSCGHPASHRKPSGSHDQLKYPDDALGHLDRSRLIATTLPQRRHVLLLPSLERRFSSSPKNDLRAAKRGLEDCASARFSTISRRAVDRPRIVTRKKAFPKNIFGFLGFREAGGLNDPNQFISELQPLRQ